MLDDNELDFYTEHASNYNCYAFALKAKSEIDGHPGSASGNYLRSLVPCDIDSSLRSDGLLSAGYIRGCLAPAKDGYYLVAAVAAGTETTGRRDYHFYRQMSDGSWWHKPGKIAPTNLDAEGNVITNPELQDRDYTKGSKEGNPNRRTGYDNFQIHYNKFVGYYYVPMAGLQVAMGGLPDHIIESPAMRKEREFNQACARLSSNIREPEIGTHFQYNANLWFSRSL